MKDIYYMTQQLIAELSPPDYREAFEKAANDHTIRINTVVLKYAAVINILENALRTIGGETADNALRQAQAMYNFTDKSKL